MSRIGLHLALHHYECALHAHTGLCLFSVASCYSWHAARHFY